MKALESAAAQQSCHLSPGAEAPAIDEGILEISYLGMVHLHLQRKERILLAAGVQCLVSSSTPLRFIENSFSVQAQSLTSTESGNYIENKTNRSTTNQTGANPSIFSNY